MGPLRIERQQTIERLQTIELLHRIEPQRVRVHQHLKGQQLTGRLGPDRWGRILLLVQIAQVQVALAQVVQVQAEVAEVEDDINS